jgi:hypothetical protein
MQNAPESATQRLHMLANRPAPVSCVANRKDKGIERPDAHWKKVCLGEKVTLLRQSGLAQKVPEGRRMIFPHSKYSSRSFSWPPMMSCVKNHILGNPKGQESQQ